MNEILNNLVSISTLITFEKQDYNNSAEIYFHLKESKKHTDPTAIETYNRIMKDLQKNHLCHLKILRPIYKELMQKLSNIPQTDWGKIKEIYDEDMEVENDESN